MLLSEYLSEVTETINEFTKTRLIVSTDLVTDFRTEKIGIIRGEIIFSNGSKLFFKEYLDLGYQTRKEAYSFHYQDKDGTLIFRYDNALHKPALTFKGHKHVGNKIFQSENPNLHDILGEIISDDLMGDKGIY